MPESSLSISKVPELSIVIPCYNSGIYLREAIESARSQQGVVVEVIVVDDGSDDLATKGELEAAAESGVTVIHTENRGLSAARNTGMRAAAAPYILLLDGDDHIDSRYANLALCAFREDPALSVVSCDVMMFGDIEGRFGPDYTLGRLMNESILSAGGAVFRTADALAIGGFTEGLSITEDHDFFLRLLTDAEDARVAVRQIHEPLYWYRKHGTSITAVADPEKVIDARAFALANNVELIKKYPRDYVEYRIQERALLAHFKRRYSRSENFISDTADILKKFKILSLLKR